MDPLRATIEAIRTVSSIYKVIQDLRGVPLEFNEVNRNLLLAQDTLSQARKQLEGQALDVPSEQAIRDVLNGCEEKTNMLLDLFKKIKDGAEKAKEGSVVDLYRTVLLRLGKAHRVETLMQGIMRDVATLVANQSFKIENKVVEVREAIDKLSQVESSVPDSEFDTSGTNSQNIASGGTGHQYNISGQNNKAVYGGGNMYNASSMTFVQPREDKKTRESILQGLSTLSYFERMNRNPNHVPGTCEWFMKHEKFQHWRKSTSSSMLWVSADPGCGKSVLAKYLVKVLETTDCRTTCYFFFKDDFKDQRSARSALSCILHQLFQQQQESYLSDEVIRHFQTLKKPGSNSYYELWDLWDILILAAKANNKREIICIIDAFDECDDYEREELTKALCKLYGPESDCKNGVALKFLVTSRPYKKIRRGFQPIIIPGLPVIHLEGEGPVEKRRISQEIDIYIEHEVSRIQIDLNLEAEEKNLLLKNLQAIPHQTYLWVYLTIDWIEKEISHKITQSHIRNIASSLPCTVDEAYNRILDKSENGEEAKRLLHIIVGAAWPLTLAEIDLALSIRKKHTTSKNLPRRPDKRVEKHIRDLCGLFVNITNSKVYLLHQTAKEFLVPKCDSNPPGVDSYPTRKISKDHDTSQLTWKSSLRPSESHRILCHICISYLLFDEFETNVLSENRSDSHKDYVFLDYAAKNWAAHLLISDIKESDFINQILVLCDVKSSRCQTWFHIYWTSKHPNPPQNFTTLMIASYFGLEEVVKTQIELEDIDIDFKDGTYYRSALSWASENGFENVVKLLVPGSKLRFRKFKLQFARSAEIDSIDIDGRTPLSHAIWKGHEAIAKRLVKAGARLDCEDYFNGTPLYYAISAGRIELLEELVKGTQTALMDEIGRHQHKIRDKVLLSAASRGSDIIVKKMLEDGAPVMVMDELNHTPLSLAALRGHDGVVKLLLEHDADVEAKSKAGETPLFMACNMGHGSIVKMLLRKGAKIKASNEGAITPLHQACHGGYEQIVKLLLENGADIEARNEGDITPLHQACQRGYEQIVKLLLKNGANFEAKSKAGKTPLFLACMKGHTSVIKILLKRGANPEARYEDDTTLLQWACQGGYEPIVQLLLEYGADIEAKSKAGETPLFSACIKGHESVVKILLKKGANIGVENKKGETMLFWAINGRHDPIIELLLKNGAKYAGSVQRRWSMIYTALFFTYVSLVLVMYTF